MRNQLSATQALGLARLDHLKLSDSKAAKGFRGNVEPGEYPVNYYLHVTGTVKVRTRA